MRLQNKVTIVTGGGSGIGRAIALRFAAEGAKIVVADINPDGAAKTVSLISDAGGQATAVTVDVSNAAQVKGMIQHTLDTYDSRIDVLVNNAAIAGGDDIMNMDEPTWDRDVEVVLKSVYLCCKAAFPTMMSQKKGAVVNIASVNGLSSFGHMAYSAGKAGVINLTKNLALNYGSYNIRINAVCPGTIKTPIWEEREKLDPQIFERLSRWYPLGRVGEPEDVASAALFLASDEAAWITGEALKVDGGLLAGSFRMSQELEARSPEQTGGTSD